MVGLLGVSWFGGEGFLVVFSLIFLLAIAVVTSFFPQGVLSVEYFFK